MIVGAGIVAIIVLAVILIASRGQKNTGAQIALMFLAGTIGIVSLVAVVLAWGFSGFG